METTYEDLEEGGKFELLVRVREQTQPAVEKRSFELSVEDIEGVRFPLIVWEKSKQGRNTEWKEGSWYRLSGVTVNEWPSGKVAHGTSSLEVEHLGVHRGTTSPRVLYFTDTHLGKSEHGYGSKAWSVSPAKNFKSAIDKAIEIDIDAVIHGGDIFHNPGSGITESDISICRKGLIRLAEHGIPFYFIYGNHERKAGQRVMERFIDDGLANHLGPRYEVIQDTLAVYGIDHESEWDDLMVDLEPAPGSMTTLLCLHQSLEPFTESNNPDCSFQQVLSAANTQLDLVVTGHTHTRNSKSLTGCKGWSGGATIRGGKTRETLKPSVELITVQQGQPEIQRQYL